MRISLSPRGAAARLAALSFCLAAGLATVGCQRQEAVGATPSPAPAQTAVADHTHENDLAEWETADRNAPSRPDAPSPDAASRPAAPSRPDALTESPPSAPPATSPPAPAQPEPAPPALPEQLAQADPPPAAAAEAEPAAGALLENTFGMKFAYVPSGEFKMGSPADEPLRSEEEILHKVKLSRGFYLGVYEVTQAQYAAVMDQTHFHFTPKGADKKLVAGLDVEQFPAEGVSWEDAVEFCKRLNHNEDEIKAGRKYRLPTEAEWEYACRAGTTTATAFGDELSSDQANFAGTHPYNGANQGPRLHRPTTVGSYKPNAWGLYDMHGNVWEWCYDIYNSRFYEDSPEVDPSGPAKGIMVVAQRVLRGGSWDEMGDECRSAYRTGISPFHRGKHYGFRVHCVVK